MYVCLCVAVTCSVSNNDKQTNKQTVLLRNLETQVRFKKNCFQYYKQIPGWNFKNTTDVIYFKHAYQRYDFCRSSLYTDREEKRGFRLAHILLAPQKINYRIILTIFVFYLAFV